MPEESLQPLALIRDAAMAAAVMDPLRQRLVRELAEPASGTQLARRLGQPRQRVNYHLRELEKAGLVVLVEERRKGNCTERVMRATARGYILSPEVLDGLSPRQEAHDGGWPALVAMLSRAAGEAAARAEQGGWEMPPPVVAVHAEVPRLSPEAMRELGAELAEAVRRVAAKYQASNADRAGGETFSVVLAGFPAGGPADAGDPGA